MNILLSNDDGYRAPGLDVLARTLAEGANVTVMAPERNRSGSSSALTLDTPLRVFKAEESRYAVRGTPSDCVHMAVTGLLDIEFDMVVAGINNGANLGDDVIYSGTVAAAIEGRHCGYPAIAVSLVGHREENYQTAADITAQIIDQIRRHPLPADTILNINVPDLPADQILGVRATRLGSRHKAEPVMRAEDPRGNPIFWIGPPGEAADAGEGTDFHAVNNGYVSVTPLQIDLTRYPYMQDLASWLEGVQA